MHAPTKTQHRQINKKNMEKENAHKKNNNTEQNSTGSILQNLEDLPCITQ